jgi:hypothetical protein
MTHRFDLAAGKRESLLLLAGLLSLAAPLHAEEASPAGMIVQTADGASLRGPLRELRADWSVRIGGESARLIPAGDLLGLRAAGVRLPPFPREDHLILANGDRIPFQSVRVDGDRLFFRHPRLADGKEASLPLAAVAVLWRLPPDRTRDAEKLRRRLVSQSRTRDVVLLRNGDQVAGTLSGLDARKVAMDVDGKEVGVPLAQVSAIALNTELADRLPARGPCARVVLTGTERGQGGRLLLTSAACSDGKTLTGTTAFGTGLRVPLSAVASLTLVQGRGVYLSDLPPGRYHYEPYLDDSWPQVRDANVAGHDLQLGGETYDKGISLHSQSRLTYRLNGGYQRFVALVGLDDRDGRGGSVRIRVLADGKPLDLGADRELTHSDGPRSINVSVEGVKELTLEVLFGANGNVQDVVNWAEARLVKAK